MSSVDSTPMTVADEILDCLERNEDITDSQIADYIGRPTPSVRRTRLQLERRNRIWCSGVNSDNHLMWRVVQ